MSAGDFMTTYDNGKENGTNDALRGQRSEIAWNGIRESEGSYTHEYSQGYRAGWQDVEAAGRFGTVKPPEPPKPPQPEEPFDVQKALAHMNLQLSKLRREPTWWDLVILSLLALLVGRILFHWW